MIILISLIIFPYYAEAQTLDTIIEQRSVFRTNPQIKLGNHLSDIAVNEETNKIYVSDYRANKVFIIDSNTGNTTNSIPVGSYPTRIEVNPETNKIYVLNSKNNTVSVIDGNTDKKEPDDIRVGEYPTDIAVNVFTNKIYVANRDSNTVSVIDSIRDKKEPDDIMIGKAPERIVADITQDKIYVANIDNNTVSVINGTTDKKEPDDIMVGKAPIDIAVNVFTNKIYVANLAGNTVSVINGTDKKEPDDIYIESPQQLALDYTQANRIYVINFFNKIVSIINGTTDKKEPDDIPYPYDSSLNIYAFPNRHKIFVLQYSKSAVSVINGTTSKKEPDDIHVGEGPLRVAHNYATNLYYIMNTETVSVINGFNDKIVAGVTFNVSPENSGNILCNKKVYPTSTYIYRESGTKCVAKPNKDFEFSGWVENLGHNSTITLNTSAVYDSPVNSILRLFDMKRDDPAATFEVNRYGSFTVNFKPLPPPIPVEYWIPLYGIIVSSIVGWSIPSIIGWMKSKRQEGTAKQYYNRINSLYNDDKLDYNDIADLDRLKTDITYAYAKGKISEQYYANLRSETSVLYEEIYKKKIDSLNSSDEILLDKIKDDIKDAYAKGKINEQHYKLLNEKIFDSENSQQHNNRFASSQKSAPTATTQGSPIKT